MQPPKNGQSNPAGARVMCGLCFQLQWNFMSIVVGNVMNQQKIPDLQELTRKALNIRCGEHAPEPPVETGLIVPDIHIVPNGKIG